ncbi:hypothetical protein N6H18_12695 [Reichenbachiella agarivorans]|uniref:Uncharacterized protein n=1 Tax=Reichenbachiella agarivorans TaxID=2979464 RepID=A0ABY6CL03_9BACT|nr:hypothetical protein [Reichenbachiella agarivorans]UXP31207.1 hypothetical protein N6H18_12695 [Reichenbachiella agarivorans]
MKTIFTLLLAICSLTVSADNGKYEKAMLDNIQSIYTAASTADLDRLTNTFSRIGDAEKDKWEPYYYASLSQVFKAFRIKDAQVQDKVLDEALVSLSKADGLSENNSEIKTMEGFIYMIKIGVDPGTRGQTLSPKIYGLFTKAMQLDPNNPRAVLFMGQMQMGTAEFFGQPLDQSCQLIMKSLEMFDTQASSNPLAPTWGSYGLEEWTSKCNGAE